MVSIVEIKGLIQPDGTRETTKEHLTFKNINQGVQWLEENAVHMIQDGYIYDYHISRSLKPGEVCEFKEWRKEENGITIEICYFFENLLL